MVSQKKQTNEIRKERNLRTDGIVRLRKTMQVSALAPVLSASRPATNDPRHPPMSKVTEMKAERDVE